MFGSFLIFYVVLTFKCLQNVRVRCYLLGRINNYTTFNHSCMFVSAEFLFGEGGRRARNELFSRVRCCFYGGAFFVR